MKIQKNALGYIFFSFLVLLITIVFYIYSSAGKISSSITPTYYKVSKSIIRSEIALVGTLVPESTDTLYAPIEGTIKRMNFNIGDLVTRDQILLEISTDVVEASLREAEASLLKAQLRLREYENWDQNSEVIRARSSVTSSTLAFHEAQRRAEENRVLLERGIIPKIEYDSSVQQMRNQELQLDMANRDYEASIKRGSDAYRRIAELEFLSATEKIEELRHKERSSLVVATKNGVVLAAASSREGGSAQDLSAGIKVSQGQAILRLASTEKLVVATRVNEIDVSKLKNRLPAEISVDAFPHLALRGTLARISGQPTIGGENGQLAGYDLIITLDENDSPTMPRLRSGMSVAVKILLDEQARITVPPEFIISEENGKFVLVLEKDVAKKRKVVVGESRANGVVIDDGLDDGLVLAMPR